MINRYTADRKVRSDDAYTGGLAGKKRPDRASHYSQRCKEAYKHVPLVLGGIEASLRRIAHYDYWSDKVRRSILMDATADILLYGNAERAIVEVAQRLARGEPVEAITDVRGTAFIRKDTPEGWFEIDSLASTARARSTRSSTYVNTQDLSPAPSRRRGAARRPERSPAGGAAAAPKLERDRTVIRLPSFEGAQRSGAIRPPAGAAPGNQPGNAARWCSVTTTVSCGSIRRRFR